MRNPPEIEGENKTSILNTDFMEASNGGESNAIFQYYFKAQRRK